MVNSGSATNPIYGVAEFQFSIWSWYNSNFEFLDINGDGILEALLGQSTGLFRKRLPIFVLVG